MARNGSVFASAKINHGFESDLVLITQKMIYSLRNMIHVSSRPQIIVHQTPKIRCQSADPKNSADLRRQADGSAVRTPHIRGMCCQTLTVNEAALQCACSHDISRLDVARLDTSSPHSEAWDRFWLSHIFLIII